MKQIVINIAETGELTIEAVGYKGSACEKATKAMEQALGTPGKRSKKPEYYQTNTQTQKAGL